jgi:Phosphorylase superfamily
MAGAPRPYPPLLLVCALRIERMALRGGLRRAAGKAQPPSAGVLRTGMGPRAATEAVRAAVPPRAPAAVIATGFCAGLAPGMHPGDVVVASEVHDAYGANPVTVACPEAERLSSVLRDHGLRVHLGTMVSADHVVRGQERAVLHADGAIAVDMESTATLGEVLAAAPDGGGPAGRTVAAVRVVVDTPEHELVRIGTLRTGPLAFRSLRAAVPAFLEWHLTSAGTPPAPNKHRPLSQEVS